MQNLCGICGNNDGSYDRNDWAMGPHVNNNADYRGEICEGQLPHSGPDSKMSTQL